MPLLEIPLDRIRIEGRARKELGDLESLCASIQAVGLLQPVGVDTSNKLLFGQRRVAAYRKLGLRRIDARVIDLDDPLRIERDENACRKDFTPSEMVAIGRAMEEREKEEARKRQEATRAKPGEAANKRGTNFAPPISNGKAHAQPVQTPAPQMGKTKDKVAASLGTSAETYRKAKEVVVAAEKDPALKPIVEVMDQTGKVDAAYKTVKKIQAKDKPTEQEAARVAAARWYGIMHGLFVQMNSIRDIGGIEVLMAEWNDDERTDMIEQIGRIHEVFGGWLVTVKGEN